MLVRPRLRDAALSDMIGTSILLAVTIVIVGASTVAFMGTAPDRADPPRIDLVANATASSSGVITLRHAGGPSLDRAVNVVVASSSWTGPRNFTLPPGSDFELGASIVAGFGQPLNASDVVDVILYAEGSESVLGMASFIVAPPPGTTTPPASFTVQVTDPAPGPTVHPTAGGTLHVSALVSHSGGRKAIDRVVVDLTGVRGPSNVTLYDDGRFGDAVARDGNYSAFVSIPPEAPLGPALLAVSAYDLDGNDRDAAGVPASASFPVHIEPSVDISSILNIVNQSGGGNGTQGNPGGSGPGGSGGAAGQVGLSGPQGAPGANGTAGTGVQFGPPPVVTSISPTTGTVGTMVTLTGENMHNLSNVVLAEVGATSGYVAPFSYGLGSPPGTVVLFVAPNAPDREYVVNVTRLDGAWATAPETFTLTYLQPEITSVTPSSATAYEQVQVNGRNFTGVQSVSLFNASVGDVAVPWSFVDDQTIVFVTHPGLPPGQYDVTVSNGVKNATAPLGFTSLTPPAPQGLSLDPTSAVAEEVVTISGTNLETVARVVLNQTNATRLIDAGWYLDGGSIKMIVPVTAAPGGNWTIPYRIDLTGSFIGVVTVPETLTVLPTDVPDVMSFNPPKGEPFTQVNIFGSNFVNVKSVTFGQTAVYFAVASSRQILAVTHAGLAPGNYTINVTTATGWDVTTATFEALPLKLVPVYNRDYISTFAVNTTVSREDNNAHITNVTVKIRSANGWNVTAINFVPVNYAWLTGSNPVNALTRFCGPQGNVTAWTGGSMQNAWGLHKYAPSYNEMDYYFEVILTRAGQTVTTYVLTNAQAEHFILPARVYAQTVLDQGFPSNDNFRDCNP